MERAKLAFGEKAFEEWLPRVKNQEVYFSSVQQQVPDPSFHAGKIFFLAFQTSKWIEGKKWTKVVPICNKSTISIDLKGSNTSNDHRKRLELVNKEGSRSEN